MKLPRLTCVITLMSLFALPGWAQSSGSDSDQGAGPMPVHADSGIFSWVETVEGTPSTIGQAAKIDSSLNLHLTKMFSATVGVPYYYVRATTSTTSGQGNSTTTTNTTTTNPGFGNAYVQIQLKPPTPYVDYSAQLTGYIPTGSILRGFSTGRGTFDLNNRFEKDVLLWAPYVEAGFGNTVTDSKYFIRPFTTLGKVGHVDGGVEYNFTKKFTLGASGYDMIPVGLQKMYSKLVARGTTGSSSSQNSFQKQAFLQGAASLVRDQGLTGYTQLSGLGIVDIGVGFTRSVQYKINSADITVSCNMTRLLHAGL